MELLFWVHLLLTFTLISIPFWSIKYLQYGVFIPLIVSFIWVVFGGCPLTQFHEIESSSFSQDILRKFIPDATDKFTDNINTFILIAVTVIGFIRLQNILQPIKISEQIFIDNMQIPR